MITNFGGNLRFTPPHVYAPTCEAEVLDILDRHAHGKIRVIGSLHSWSPAVVCDDAVVDMRHFDNVAIHQADGATWATVGGGCKIKDLLHKLHHLGNVTMPSLGLITEQTIAGAISTATHGSGRHSLSHYIEEVRLAAYDADTDKARIYTVSAGPELRAARCALGCMGIILTVRIRCVPKYEVAETVVPCPSLDEALTGEDDHPLQQFYLVPHLWRYFAQRRSVPAGFSNRRQLSAKLYRAWWFLSIDVGLHLVIKLLTCVLKSPTLTRFFFRRVLSKLILTNTTIIDHGDRMLVMEHELFRHLEIEIFVPSRHLRAATMFVRTVTEVCAGTSGPDWQSSVSSGSVPELERLRGSFTHHYPITFRRVLPDDALISMTSPSPPAALPDETNVWYAMSLITYVEPRDEFLAMATFLGRSMTQFFGARLHWGKFFPLTNAEIEASYPGLEDFRAICRRVDPHGVFRNEFVERVLFGS